MVRRIVYITIPILIIIVLSTCFIYKNFLIEYFQKITNQQNSELEEIESGDTHMIDSKSNWTEAVPADYFNESIQPGKVEKFEYSSKDYAGDSSEIVKTAYVYTPYNYDENQNYNILYLMHGWGGYAGDFFDFAGIKNLFDNLIEKGDIPPLIIVTPTFYNNNTSTDFNSSVNALRAFHNDFENNLIPAVESTYSTFAQDTTPEGLQASRDHRAFGGFSLGSVTTWLEFCYDTDYIKYFLPMSGASWYYGSFGDFRTKENVDFIEQLVKDNNLDERGYFIFHTTGTEDAVKSQTLMQASEMLSRNTFTPDHYQFYQKLGGQHNFDAVSEYLYNALPLFFKEENQILERQNMTASFTPTTPISEVINDPALKEFGRLMFPVNTNYYSGNTLGDLRLTWYSNIDPNKTVEITNYIRSQAEDGKPIFYDIYTEEEMKADPGKRDTGLFFFKGNPGERFAIINAGGGFAYVGAMQDSFPQALELSKKGYNSFALIYRPGWETAFEDLARAISFIFANAKEFEVNTDGYSLWGGSAGARMAATLGAFGPGYFGGNNLPRAGTVITQYSGYNNVLRTDPPTYANVGTNDYIANWRTMQNRLATMKSLGIPTEFHVYNGLSHGFGLGTGTEAEGWIDDAVAFWEKQVNN